MAAQLAGKVALVTGGGRGIGPVIARKLAEGGAAVVVHYANSRAGADEVVRSIAGKGGKAFSAQADLRERGDILRMFSDIDRAVKTLDILVNCAGISAGTSLLAEVNQEEVETIVGVNMLAPYYLAVEAAKRMPSGGRIINFSSSVVHFTLARGSIYAGAKAAVETFTKIWARELGTKGITVNTVIPGATRPGMMDDAPQHQAFFAKASPFGRIGTANEVTSVVAFLCSPEASWVSGAQILVNGAGSA